MITQERLKEVLYYHPESGDFVWLKHPQELGRDGTQAGFPHNKGYRVIALDDERYLAHRLAVLYMAGAWPANEVDHEDTVKHHNWWNNLRGADDEQNAQNRGTRADNVLNEKGICWNKRSQKFIVQVQAGGVRCAKRAATLAEAVAIRNDLVVQMHGNFARVA